MAQESDKVAHRSHMYLKAALAAGGVLWLAAHSYTHFGPAQTYIRVELSDEELGVKRIEVSDIKCLPSMSQSGEDTIVLQQFFPGKVGGTYVEIGALDGMLFTNTIVLHTCHQWNGVLIEANPANFQSLRVNAAKTRPNAQLIETAVCSPPQTSVTFTAKAGPVSGSLDTMAGDFKERWHSERRVQTVETPCKPMTDILEECGVQHVDFFSLDVEGAELAVLESMNFNAITVDVFVIELDGSDEVKDWKIRNLLRNLGYRECEVHEPRNGYFVHERLVNADCKVRNQVENYQLRGTYKSQKGHGV